MIELKKTIKKNDPGYFFVELLDSAPDAIVIVDEQGIISIINKQTEKLFGYERNELVGNTVELLIPLNFRKQHKKYRAGYLKEPHYRSMGVGLELSGLHKDGSTFPVEISLSPIHHNNEIFVAAAIRDKTEQKKINDENKLLNEKLEISNKDLKSFSYSVSHDLRAPLRHISGFSRILEEHLKSNLKSHLDKKAIKYFDIIKNSIHVMNQLIDDLLEYSRIGRMKISKKYFKMDLTLRAAMNIFTLEIKDKNIEWKLGKLHKACFDHELIKLVWQNLLSNAIKFTSKTQNPVIEIGSYEDDEWVIYYIKDNGVGFDEAYKDKLFGVFQRLHSAVEFEGVGIGLANVQRIISLHGGKVWAESLENEGAAFYFNLKKEVEDD